MSKKKLTKKKKKQLLALFATTTMTVNMAMAPLSVLAEENESSDADSVGNVLEENVNLPAETMTSDVDVEQESKTTEEKAEEKEIKTSESSITEKEEIGDQEKDTKIEEKEIKTIESSIIEKEEGENQKNDNKTTLTGSYENNGTWTFNQENGLLVLSGGTLSASIGADSWLKEIKKEDVLEIQVLDAVGAEDSSELFSGYYKAKKMSFNNFDTSRVTNMLGMFEFCQELIDIDLSGFDTSKVTNMRNMFWNSLRYATKLDVSNFNTSQVEDMHGMFGGSNTFERGLLTELDVSNFDTSQVKSMNGMFNACSNLKELDVSNFDTSQVTNMGGMFRNCSNLKELDVSNFDTSQVQNFQSMFGFCSNLIELDLSNFDTRAAKNEVSMTGRGMNSMFEGCTNLVKLDLSGFETQVDQYGSLCVGDMFKDCINLTVLTLGEQMKLANFMQFKALSDNEFWQGSLDNNLLNSSDELIAYHNELGNTNTYTLITKEDETVFETDDYHIGDYNITGRFSAPIVTAQLRINGNISNKGGTFNQNDGTFYYYAGAGRIQTGQEVVLEGLDKSGNIIETVNVEPKVAEGTLSDVQHTVGSGTITGTYTGEMSKARLVVNGNIISVGGTFKEGTFSYYVAPNQVKETDTVQLQGYDKEGNPVGDLTPVTIQKQQGQLTEATYKLDQSTITGTYEGNVKKARLLVDGKQISWGGTFKEGTFSYYVAPGIIKANSTVTLEAYGEGDVLLAESFNVTVYP
ncbi:BspA family leucine-rich repeat surface protein [Enterococcus faecalis]|nr:BspA family leucine-rich repeat surface protein [Enterococcus faecalis]ELT8947988.1 BspA family leucine-rich repeat surface protein [Enterococcus faecalis]